MKKILTTISSLFILLGLQAQTKSAKKETKPTTAAKPIVEKSNTTQKITGKTLEIKRTGIDTHIKKSGQ